MPAGVVAATRRQSVVGRLVTTAPFSGLPHRSPFIGYRGAAGHVDHDNNGGQLTNVNNSLDPRDDRCKHLLRGKALAKGAQPTPISTGRGAPGDTGGGNSNKGRRIW